MPKFAANLGFLWADRPLLQRIEAAARAKFRACEMHWPYETPAREVAAQCAANDIRLLGINTAAGDVSRAELGLGAVPHRQADFRRSFTQALDYVLAAGGSAIHVMAGKVAPAERPLARQMFIENLQWALAAAAPHPITLLLEPLNPRDNPGYFYSRIEAAVELIHIIASEQLKLQFDVYHVAISEGDVLTKLKRYISMIGNVQIAGVPSRTEPDEGEIAYRTVFDALDDLGYAGWVGCEYRPRGDVDAGLKWMRQLSK